MNHLRVCLLLLVLLLLGGGRVRAQLIWDRCVGTASDSEEGYQMIRLRHGGYLLAGSSTAATHYNQPYLAKISEQGDTVWTKTYRFAGTPTMEAVTVGENRSGQLLVGCRSTFGMMDALLMLCDSTGQVIWSQPYTSPLEENFSGIRLANDGKFVLLAKVLGDDSVWKIDSSGQEIWSQVVPFDTTIAGSQLLIQPTGTGYAVVTNDNLFPGRNRLYFLDEAGHLMRYSASFASGGGFLRGNYDGSHNFLLADGNLSQLDSTGNLHWSNRYSIRSRNVSLVSVAITPDGNYIALGHRYSAGSTAQLDLALLKIAPSGQIIRDTVLFTPQGEYARDVQVDGAGNYVVFGTTGSGCVGGAGSPDLIIAKFRGWRQTLGLAPAAGGASLAVWPNPATDRVRVQLPQAGATLELHNVLGQAVRLVPEGAGEMNVELPVAGLAPGVYALSCRTPQGRQTVRLVKR